MNCGLVETDADEGAEHHEIALGEIHAFGGLVDEHESRMADEAVDTAIGQAADKQLQHVQERNLLPYGARPRPRPRSFLSRRATSSPWPRKAPPYGAMNTLSVRLLQFEQANRSIPSAPAARSR